MDLAEKVVDKMISEDAFSRWLGIKVLEITEGYCKLEMTVRNEMTNGAEIIKTNPEKTKYFTRQTSLICHRGVVWNGCDKEILTNLFVTFRQKIPNLYLSN